MRVQAQLESKPVKIRRGRAAVKGPSREVPKPERQPLTRLRLRREW